MKLADMAPQFVTDPKSAQDSLTVAAIIGGAPETLRYVLDKGAPLWASDDGAIYEQEIAKYLRRPDMLEILSAAATKRGEVEPPIIPEAPRNFAPKK